MRSKAGFLGLSASDISNHLACQHLTELNRSVAEGRLEAPQWRDPMLAVLQKRGLAHENAYTEHLRARGLQVVLPEDGSSSLSIQSTLDAMNVGADAIVQAELESGRWIGRVDFLCRVERPSKLGNWSYEVIDTKLAMDTRAGTILQLCLYSELLGKLQGIDPTHMYVVKRDKVNFDLIWIKDKSLEETEDLPEPDVLAQEITEDLLAAHEQFAAVLNGMKGD